MLQQQEEIEMQLKTQETKKQSAIKKQKEQLRLKLEQAE